MIGWLDPDDPHHDAVIAALLSAEAEDSRFSISAISYAELMSNRSDRRRKRVRDWLDALGESAVVSVDAEIAAAAGAIRARRKSIGLADALIAATAKVSGAERLLTTDRALARLDGVTYVGRAGG